MLFDEFHGSLLFSAGTCSRRDGWIRGSRNVGAMRLMTVGTIFHDRWVLPQERTAPLGVAAQAILVGRALDELLGIRRSVWIMATGAGHLAFAVGHVRRALQLCTPHLMALQAQLRLRLLHALVLAERSVIAGIRRKCRVQLL